MTREREKPKFSGAISSFCELMTSAQKDYVWNYEEVNRMDRLTQDYLHKLELENLDYKERAKVATQLAKCRQSRRECKDTVVGHGVNKKTGKAINFISKQSSL